MKFLLLLAIVLLVVWLWRGGRDQERAGDAQDRSARPRPGPAQQDMVQCSVCSVHLPRPDALPGSDGRFYCCAEHRDRGAG